MLTTGMDKSELRNCRLHSIAIFDLRNSLAKSSNKMGPKFLVTALVVGCVLSAASADLTMFKKCARKISSITCEEATIQAFTEAAKAAVECKNEEAINTVLYNCAKDPETGAYCSEVSLYIGVVSDIFTTCGAELFNDTIDCTDACVSALRMLRDDLGCCINGVFNVTKGIYAFTRPAFSYEFWQKCGLEPVTRSCTDIPSIDIPDAATRPANSPECTYGGFVEKTLTLTCQKKQFGKMEAALTDDEDCQDYLEYVRQLCSVDADGDFCLATEQSDSDFTTHHTPITTQCTSSETCSDECRQSLMRFNSNRGCCINALYNSTYTEVLGQNGDFPYLNTNNQFDLCGVEPPPQACEKFSLPLSGSQGMIPYMAAIIAASLIGFLL